MRKRGFTIVETLVTMAVIGILFVFSGKVYTNVSKVVYRSEVKEDVSNIGESLRLFLCRVDNLSVYSEDNRQELLKECNSYLGSKYEFGIDPKDEMSTAAATKSRIVMVPGYTQNNIILYGCNKNGQYEVDGNQVWYYKATINKSKVQIEEGVIE